VFILKIFCSSKIPIIRPELKNRPDKIKKRI